MTVFMRSAKAGQMFATEFVLLGLYAALFRLARLVNPAHEWLLQPFPGLLYRWQRLVRLPVSIYWLSQVEMWSSAQKLHAGTWSYLQQSPRLYFRAWCLWHEKVAFELHLPNSSPKFRV